MKKNTQEVFNKLCENWQKAKDLQNNDAAKRGEYVTEFETVNGFFSWNEADMVLLADFVERYACEEYGSIVGLKKDGTLKWVYQSHCSCNSFDDNDGRPVEAPQEGSRKSFELGDVPEDWEDKLVASAEKLLAAL